MNHTGTTAHTDQQHTDPDETRAFDLGAWLTACGWTGTARDQARAGFNAGWGWAARADLGADVKSADEVYDHGRDTVGAYFGNGFDAGRSAYESGDYPGGIDDY